MFKNFSGIFGGKCRFALLSAVLIFAFSVSAFSQTTLVTWNFPNSPDDTTADGGIASNLTKTITTNSTGTTISYPAGVTTASISNTGWVSVGTYWQVSFDTTLYGNITIASAQKSSNTGPRDFKIQYSLNGTDWTDVANVPAVANDATTPWAGTVSGIVLPADANNKSVVYVRWVTTSTTSVSGGTVASGGTSRIDDIVITGTAYSAADAFIIGRVTDSEGRGIKKAVMTLSGGNLAEPKTVMTNAFGIYNFQVPAGETYVVTVNTNRYNFPVRSRVINLQDNVTDADFSAVRTTKEQ